MAASRAYARSPAIKITGFEAELGSPYTYATVRFVTRHLPRVHFVWVMGADNLATFHHWQRWRDIARLVPIAVVDRPGWHLKALASPGARFLARARLPEDRAALLPRTPASRLGLSHHPAVGGVLNRHAGRQQAVTIRNLTDFCH